MRDVTKSIFSFSWAMSLFGIQQTLNLVEPSKAAKAFDNVTQATKEEIGETLKATFKAGDNLQRGLMDVTLGIFSGQALTPSRMMRMTSEVVKQSVEAVGQGIRAATSDGQRAASGWGPMPASSPSRAPDPRASAGSRASTRASQSSESAPFSSASGK